MVYIDTSSFFKVLVKEEFSSAVTSCTCILDLPDVAVSDVLRLEIEVQIRGLGLGGKVSANKSNKLSEQAAIILEMRPFMSVPISGNVFATASDQHRRSSTHCRSLDRLHLAVMEELGIKRLMTHDIRQAEVAREMGIEVLMPGVE